MLASPPKGLRVSVTGKHSAVTDLSPNGSRFVIQHMSHLVNNNFLSVPDTPGKFGSLLIWGGILGSVAKAAGLRLLVSEVEIMEGLL